MTLFLHACTSLADKVDTSNESGAPLDTAGDSDTSSETSSETGSDSEDDTSGDTHGDTGEEPLAGALTASGSYGVRQFSLACAAGDPEAVFSRLVNDALGNLAGSVICSLLDAPHDRFTLLLTRPQVGSWNDPLEGNNFEYSGEEGYLGYSRKDLLNPLWHLEFTTFAWVDSRTVQLVGSATGVWTSLDGTPYGDVEAAFDVLIPCGNCP